MKNTAILLLAILAMLCSNCKKDINIIHISPGLFAHFSFKPGTWWIYKDSITGRVDSFSVKTNDFSTYESQGHEYDANSMSINSYKLYGPSPFDSLYWAIFLEGSSLELDLSSYRLAYGSLMKYPFSLGSYNSAQGLTSVVNIYNSYGLNTVSYSNVAEIHIAKSNGRNDLFYISDDVGIIKMSLDIPADTANHIDSLRCVWELQRCNIVR